ncbi:MAG: aspartate aminotransferase family protein [Caulobacteraceae bacterium]
MADRVRADHVELRPPVKCRASDANAIGGVMGAEACGAPASASLWNMWADGWSHQSTFRSARSALAALLAHRQIRRVWLPAYVCVSIAKGAWASGAQVCFYPCGAGLDPDFRTLGRELSGGDAIVGVDYFGRAHDEGWLALRQRYDDLTWIEDRAQALDPGVPPWGEALIYSPRKLVGVGDGGLLFGNEVLPLPSGTVCDPDLWAPEDARALDPDGLRPEAWRPAFRKREAAFHVDGLGASARTLTALRRLPARPIAEIRRKNWASLARELADFALWPDLDPSFVPLAFPILVRDPSAAVLALAERRIWAPRHWSELPSGADKFPDARWLSEHCLSLPLDQRYGSAEMWRIALAVRASAQPIAQAR